MFQDAAVSPRDGRLDSLIWPPVNGACKHLFLPEIASRHPNERIVRVMDGAGWHKNGQFPLPPNLRLVFLPP